MADVFKFGQDWKFYIDLKDATSKALEHWMLFSEEVSGGIEETVEMVEVSTKNSLGYRFDSGVQKTWGGSVEGQANLWNAGLDKISRLQRGPAVDFKIHAAWRTPWHQWLVGDIRIENFRHQANNREVVTYSMAVRGQGQLIRRASMLT